MTEDDGNSVQGLQRRPYKYYGGYKLKYMHIGEGNGRYKNEPNGNYRN